MTALEIEVKFFLESTGPIEEHVKALGAAFGDPVDETNIRYETEDNALYASKSLLRLRRAGRDTLLTFKSESQPGRTDYKIHTEYEVSVDNFEMMRNILESLGFHQAQVYEKKRRICQLGDVTLCLDTMPYGVFLELEGPGEAIRDVAGQLGLAWEERILMNYLEMFDRIRSEKGLAVDDVTFDNFRTVPLAELAALIKSFRAGGAGAP
ncbi:MAG: class IV adenylate cyclase [Thermodesulfobacteriota bacterium]